MEASVVAEKGKSGRHLHLKVNDQPPWNVAILFGCQQASLCISGLLVFPFLVSEIACAGDATISVRVQLIAATFVASGVATLLQTTIGLRLSILNGTAVSFLPPLLAFANMPENKCHHSMNETVPEEEWKGRLQTISGSLFLACLVFIVVGATGAVGAFSKAVGPITIVPLLILLTTSVVPTLNDKLSLHWISIVMVVVMVTVAVFLEDVHLPLPLLRRPLSWRRVRLFGQFPYLISISLVWLICLILTLTGAEPPEGAARTDRVATIKVLHESPWFQIPYPGRFGFPRLDVGLMLGFTASSLSSVIENLGSYSMTARVSEQRRPPRSAVNRAIMVEGIGSMIAALLGVCSGVTTFTDNVALMHMTRVASRVTMQIAGGLLIVLGVFTKAAALLASIPDPIVGGIITMGMSMIAGVALAQLQMVDLQLTRNLSIMGVSLMLGMVVPTHFERVPIHTGNATLNSTLNMLLTIRMLIGGGIAFILDNTVPGATKEQRGFSDDGQDFDCHPDDDGYAFPDSVNRLLGAFPALSRLPFLPSQKNLAARASRVSMAQAEKA